MHESARYRGGPLDGFTIPTTAAKGAVAVDLSTGRVWVYDWEGTELHGRDAGPEDDEKISAAGADPERSILVIGESR